MGHEDYKKAGYAIPTFTVGGSTRTNTVSTGGGVGNVIKVLSGSDTCTFTIWGLKSGSTQIFSESLAVTSTSSGIQTSTTNWTYSFGMIMNNKYGNAMSTESVDTYFYAVSTSGNEVGLISSSEKSDKAQIFELTGKNTTIHGISGNIYMTSVPLVSGTTIVMPTSNSGFKMTDAMLKDERIRNYIFLNSDTGGATAQIQIWED